MSPINCVLIIKWTVSDLIMIRIPSQTFTATFCPIAWLAIAIIPSFPRISSITKWTRIVWISDCTKVMPSKAKSVSHTIIRSVRYVSIPVLTSSPGNSSISISTYKCLSNIERYKIQKEFHSLLVHDYQVLMRYSCGSRIVNSKIY